VISVGTVDAAMIAAYKNNHDARLAPVTRSATPRK